MASFYPLGYIYKCCACIPKPLVTSLEVDLTPTHELPMEQVTRSLSLKQGLIR